MARRHLAVFKGTGGAVLPPAVPAVHKRVRHYTSFQQDVIAWGADPQVKALSLTRKMTFGLGEPVDSLTLALKARLATLKGQTVAQQ